MFYALYSIPVIPNTKGAYQTLSEFTAAARRNREIPITCFADNSRTIIQDFDGTYITLDEYVDTAINWLENAKTKYADSIPRWTNQPHYVEIWTEKDAMVGTLRAIIGDKQEVEVRAGSVLQLTGSFSGLVDCFKSGPASPPPPNSGSCVTGTDKNDNLIGTSQNECINGKGGNDKISGLAGNDKLNGNDGNDLRAAVTVTMN